MDNGAILALAFIVAPLWAQDASLSGRITDPTGAALIEPHVASRLPPARTRCTEASTNFCATAPSTREIFFDFGGIPQLLTASIGSTRACGSSGFRITIISHKTSMDRHRSEAWQHFSKARFPTSPPWNPAFQGPLILGGPNQYFNPNAFIVPANGTYGNVGRDVLIGPGIATVDFSALKNTKVTEKLKLQIRGEFFNVLNHTNFATPNTIVFSSDALGPSPTAGVITATSSSSRQIQIGAKLLW